MFRAVRLAISNKLSNHLIGPNRSRRNEFSSTHPGLLLGHTFRHVCRRARVAAPNVNARCFRSCPFYSTSRYIVPPGGSSDLLLTRQKPPVRFFFLFLSGLMWNDADKL
ncbi:hypothetical protein OUZ56_025320 [Daphnia magna]|uniref:Uncharacterized protein n=1 Tax=Daphnia magna TaxID=35525 RepID=A0ABQ9ZJI4_9CRUS|nr:hypothetical protein OUZ56_025320 [Daphnia magna]